MPPKKTTEKTEEQKAKIAANIKAREARKAEAKEEPKAPTGTKKVVVKPAEVQEPDPDPLGKAFVEKHSARGTGTPVDSPPRGKGSSGKSTGVPSLDLTSPQRSTSVPNEKALNRFIDPLAESDSDSTLSSARSTNTLVSQLTPRTVSTPIPKKASGLDPNTSSAQSSPAVQMPGPSQNPDISLSIEDQLESKRKELDSLLKQDAELSGRIYIISLDYESLGSQILRIESGEPPIDPVNVNELQNQITKKIDEQKKLEAERSEIVKKMNQLKAEIVNLETLVKAKHVTPPISPSPVQTPPLLPPKPPLPRLLPKKSSKGLSVSSNMSIGDLELPGDYFFHTTNKISNAITVPKEGHDYVLIILFYLKSDDQQEYKLESNQIGSYYLTDDEPDEIPDEELNGDRQTVLRLSDSIGTENEVSPSLRKDKPTPEIIIFKFVKFAFSVFYYNDAHGNVRKRDVSSITKLEWKMVSFWILILQSMQTKDFHESSKKNRENFIEILKLNNNKLSDELRTLLEDFGNIPKIPTKERIETILLDPWFLHVYQKMINTINEAIKDLLPSESKSKLVSAEHGIDGIRTNIYNAIEVPDRPDEPHDLPLPDVISEPHPSQSLPPKVKPIYELDLIEDFLTIRNSSRNAENLSNALTHGKIDGRDIPPGKKLVSFVIAFNKTRGYFAVKNIRLMNAGELKLRGGRRNLHDKLPNKDNRRKCRTIRNRRHPQKI
jgi:hypothetical protein